MNHPQKTYPITDIWYDFNFTRKLMRQANDSNIVRLPRKRDKKKNSGQLELL